MRLLSNIIKSPYIKVNVLDKVQIQVPAPVGQEAAEPIPAHQDRERLSDNILEKAEQEARRVMSEAERKAELILSKAQEQANILGNETQELARREGYETGLQEASLIAEEIKEQARQLLFQAQQERDQILADIEPRMLELMIGICEKILGDTIQYNPQGILYLIRKGFSQATAKGKYLIRIAEEDYKNVLDNQMTILGAVDSGIEFEVIKDFALQIGDCIIETPFGNIDCSLDQQFENLKKELLYISENR